LANRLAAGVDLGGTNIRIALGNDEGQILEKLMERTEKTKGPEGVANQIIKMIRLLQDKDPQAKNIVGIGIGSAGPLDLKRGGRSISEQARSMKTWLTSRLVQA